MITKDALKTKLQITVRDTLDRNWTSDEKDEAIEDALYDPAFAAIIEDTSLTAVITTQDYTIPSTIEVLSDVYLTDNSIKVRIPHESWEQINDILRFRTLPQAGALELVGHKQISNTIPDEKVNLALYLACVKLYEMLLHKYSTGLLMADITGAEIMNMLEMYERKVSKERSKLGRVTNRRGYKL